jgi:hypothetical protein
MPIFAEALEMADAVEQHSRSSDRLRIILLVSKQRLGSAAHAAAMARSSSLFEKD